MEWDEDESESRVVGHDSGSARQGAPSYLLAEESVTRSKRILQERQESVTQDQNRSSSHFNMRIGFRRCTPRITIFDFHL